MMFRGRPLPAAFSLVLLAAWLLLVGGRSAPLVVETLRQIVTRVLADADGQALRQLLARVFGESDRLGSVVFVGAVFLAVLGLPFIVRAWRPSRTLATLVAVCLSLAVGFAAGASALADVFWLLVLGAAALELGHHLLVRLSARPGDRLEAFVLRAAVGSGLLALLGLGLGAMRLLTFPWLVFLIADLVGLLAVRVGIQLFSRRSSPTNGMHRTSPPPTAFETALLGLTGASVLVGYAMALAPEVQSDAVRLHLPMARIFVRDGTVAALSHMYPSYWPVNAQVLFAIGVALHGPIVAKLLHTVAGVVTIVAVGLLARRLAGRRAGLIAAALMATLPLGIWEMGTAYVDLFATGYVVVAALCFFSWQESGDRKWLWLTGGLLGFGVASKLTVGFAAAGFVVAVAVAGRKEASSRERMRAVAWMTLGIVATLGPWLVRSVVLTGQIPGFDLLRDSLFPAAGTRPSSLGNLPTFGLGRSAALLPALPWELTFNTQRFGENPPGFVGLGLLLALPAILFIRPRRRPAALAILVLVPLVFWFFSAQYLRYLLPTLALLFVLVACGIEEFLERALPLDRGASSRSRALLAVILLMGLAISPIVYLVTILAYPGGLPVRHVLHAETSEEYLVRTMRQVPVLRRLAGLVGPGSPVAVYPEGHQLYSDAILMGPHNGASWLVWSRSVDEVLGNFEKYGISYLVVDGGFPGVRSSRAIALQQTFLQEHAATVYADRSVYLYRIQTMAPTALVSKELLLNPTFETGMAGIPEAWNPIGTPQYDTSGARSHEGRAAVHVKTTSAFSQTVSVQAGQPYVLSHFSRCDRPFLFVRLQVNWLDASGTFLSTAIEVRPGTSAYTKQTMWAQAPARAAFGVVYASTHEEAPCWFDDFSFKEVR